MTNLVEYINGLSAHWVGGMWNAVWQSTVLAFGILLLTLCLKRAPSSLRFWLWLLVPLRLLVMPILTVDIPLLPPEIPETIATEKIAAMEPQSVGISMPLENIPGDHLAGGYAEPEMSPISATAGGPVDFPPKNNPPNVWAYLMAAWACGVILIALRMSIGYWTTRRIVARATQVKDGHVLDLAQQAARMLGLRHAPRVLLTKENVSPFVLGAWRPVVVLPSSFVETVNRGQLLAVLAHEAAHLRRNDFVVGWIIAFCEVMYFFHPVVHFVNRRLLLEREKACDDWVLVASRAKPSHYAQAILTAAGSSCSVETHLKPQAVVTESFAVLSQRLSSIASTVKPKARLSARACVFLCVLGALCIPGIALTAKKAESVESVSPATITVAIARPEEATSGEIPSTTSATIGPFAQADVNKDKFRVLHFPEDSNLGTLFVLERWGIRKYRLERESEADRWAYLSEARGDVTVPTDRPLKLHVSVGGIGDAALLSSLGPDDLHTLHFDVPYATTGDEHLRHIQGLTGLVDLNVGGPAVTERGLRYIGKLEALKSLRFWSPSLPNEALANLHNLKSLEALAVIAPISDEGLRHLSALTSLRELNLMGKNIQGPGLAYLAKIPSLELLEFHGGGAGNESGGPHNRTLKYLEDLTSLKRLVLFWCRSVTDGGTPYLANLEHLEELLFVGVGEFGITDAGMRQLGNLRSLRKLDLSGTRVTDRGLKHLRSLQDLEDLRLPNSHRIGTGQLSVTDAALVHVAELPSLRHLSAGGLSPSILTDPGPFTDEGLKSLAGLDRLESLQILSGTAITDVGMAHIAELSSLRKLTVGANGVTNQGVAHLAKMKSLRHLQLWFGRGGQVTVAGINHLNVLRDLRVLDFRAVQDYAGLDLGALTKLEWLTIGIRLPHSNRNVRAYRDEDLESLGNLTHLTSLLLGASPLLTDEGLLHLSNLNRLEKLSIGGENLTDQGLAQVAEFLSLRFLIVTGDFTDQGLRQIDGMKSLRNLTVNSKRGLSPQTEQRIRRNLPNLYSLNGRRLGAGK